MDGWIICRNGVDTVVYIAGNDSQYPDSGSVVYSGRWIGIYHWGYILSVAADEVFACGLAPVCDWGNGLFLFRSAVRMYFGFVSQNTYNRIATQTGVCAQ